MRFGPCLRVQRRHKSPRLSLLPNLPDFNHAGKSSPISFLPQKTPPNWKHNAKAQRPLRRTHHDSSCSNNNLSAHRFILSRSVRQLCPKNRHSRPNNDNNSVPTTSSNTSSRATLPGSASTSDSENGGLSRTDKIALGTSLGVGIPAVHIALMAWCFPRLRHHG